jgi:hypothetical protein
MAARMHRRRKKSAGRSFREGIVSVFVCDECRSPAFAIGGRIADEAAVTCDGCGAPLGSWAEFRKHLERSLAEKTRGNGAKAAVATRRRGPPLRLA